MNKQEQEGHIFSEEGLQALSELGDVLRRVLNRLIREGKVKVVNGKVIDCATGKPIPETNVMHTNPPPD